MGSVFYVALLIRAGAGKEEQEQESQVFSPHEALEWTKCEQVNNENSLTQLQKS